MTSFWTKPLGGRARGNSTTELLIAAPVLAMMFYAAYDLNLSYELKQEMQIGARNAAFSPEVSNDKTALDAAVIGPNGIVIDDEQKAKTTTTLTTTEGAKINDFPNDLGKRAKTSFDGDAGLYRTIADVESSLAVNASLAVDTVADGINSGFRFFGSNGYLIPPSRMRTTIAGVTMAPASNAFQRGLMYSGLVSENDQYQAGSSDETKMAAMKKDISTLYYLRTEDGYHPDGYKLQGMLGFGLGLYNKDEQQKSWGMSKWHGGFTAAGKLMLNARPDIYNDHCLMNFDQGGPHCTDTSMGYFGMRSIGWTIAGVKLAMRAGPQAIVTVPAVALINGVIKAALKKGFEKAIEQPLKDLGDGLKSKLDSALDSNGMGSIEGMGEDLGGKLIGDKIFGDPQKFVDDQIGPILQGNSGFELSE